MSAEETHRSDTGNTANVEKVSSPPPATYLPALLEDDEDVVEGLEEEKVASMMRWLEREISSSPSPAAVREGNHEGSVPSFSHPASTVKAAVDIPGSVGGTSCGAVAGDRDVLTEMKEER
ncbi:hypothetical protein HPP92_005198 [Vanilla planifolia]|uniref:Uncharacterized protein n=1 Tax=Vanilla planifolia TaxID=51239 RepID=A0A835RRQ7_VANPL|nr:hypothetical protein HPP92_005497 [Vanilla planifolia]KAG0494204.1 hypothetical protein HPP92_005198 [Vanilla planifolia]